MKTARRGFTLLELLIVIGLIGILIAVATVSYSSAQKKARDSRVMSDLKAIQSAMEQFNSDNGGTYPDDCSNTSSDLSSYLTGGIPNTPKNLQYTRSCPAPNSTYCFCGPLETSAGNATTDCGGNAIPAGYTGMFCVYQRQ